MSHPSQKSSGAISRRLLEPLDDEDAPVDNVEDGEGGWEENARDPVDEDGPLPTPSMILLLGRRWRRLVWEIKRNKGEQRRIKKIDKVNK